MEVIILPVQDRIKKYLDLLGIKYNYDTEKNEFGIVYEIEGHRVYVTISSNEKWIEIMAPLLSKDLVPKDKESEFYKELLYANHKFAEVCFDVDSEGNIGTSQELLVSALTFDYFEEEFRAVPFAALHFWKNIAPKYNISDSGFSFD